MREIKFRVWNGSRITNQIRLEFAHGLRLISVEDLGFGMIGDDKCILMQFTGLKDKNGVEIYEGDIVEYKSQATSVSKIYSVRKEVTFFDGSFVPHWINRQDSEVIGNIYQNPELLN